MRYCDGSVTQQTSGSNPLRCGLSGARHRVALDLVDTLSSSFLGTSYRYTAHGGSRLIIDNASIHHRMCSHGLAPTVRRPARVGSQYLLSGLLRCGVCGKPYSAQGAKSGQFAYYVCASLFREGAGACIARYLNTTKLEDFVIGKVRERILTEETITELVTLVAEEIDNIAGEVNGRLTAISGELSDVDSRLENLYQALETKQLPIEALSPRILSLKARQDQLTAARDGAEAQLEQRRAELPTTKEIKGYVADFREFLRDGTFPERKTLIRNFVQGIEIVEDEAVLTYTIPMPQDGVTSESASVLD